MSQWVRTVDDTEIRENWGLYSMLGMTHFTSLTHSLTRSRSSFPFPCYNILMIMKSLPFTSLIATSAHLINLWFFISIFQPLQKEVRHPLLICQFPRIPAEFKWFIEQERFYGEDAPCPERLEENVVPESLLSSGLQGVDHKLHVAFSFYVAITDDCMTVSSVDKITSIVKVSVE